MLTMGRPEAGVTLVHAPSMNPRGTFDLQMLCFVVDAPLAPTTGQKPIYLTDPDGAAVELAQRPRVSNAQD